jgi:hypothetical protein
VSHGVDIVDTFFYIVPRACWSLPRMTAMGFFMLHIAFGISVGAFV